MRVIKFRAWDGIVNKMWYDVHFDPTHIYLSKWDNEKQNWKATMPRWETNPVMQYTGLKDKNGTEIYEGDRITVEGLLYVLDDIRTAHDLEPYCKAGKVEIIGNIHENPELLEDT